MCEKEASLAEIWDLSWTILEMKKSANVEHSCLFSSSVLIWADGFFWIGLNCIYFVVRLSAVHYKGLAGKAKAKDLFFKAKVKAAEFSLKTKA